MDSCAFRTRRRAFSYRLRHCGARPNKLNHHDASIQRSRNPLPPDRSSVAQQGVSGVAHQARNPGAGGARRGEGVSAAAAARWPR
jgi:hypothetical protein